MRTLRKVMLGASVSALALVVAGGVNTKTAAAEGSENETGGSTASAEAEIFTDEQMMVVTPTGEADNVFVSFDAVKKGDKWNAKATWNLYEGGEAYADLSTLKTAKDVYIAVKADDGTPNVYYIAGEKAAKVKGTYNPKTGSVKFDNVPTGAKLEFRTATGDWNLYEEKSTSAAGSESASSGTDLSVFEQQGATLYFRVAPKDYTEGKSESKADGKYNQIALTAGNLPGKEFKVKIAKKAKGPSVKIDYVKGTITKPTKEAEIKFDGGAWGKFDADKDLITLSDGGRIVALVKTAATEKKPASNPTVIAYTPGATADAKKVEVKFTAKAGGKGTIELKNNATVTYAVYEAGKEREGGKAKPLATLKAGKTVKLAESKVPSDKALTVVIAADAKNGVFQSEPVDLVTAADIKTGFSTATAAPAGSESGSENS